MSCYWLPVALFILCGLLVVLEFWAIGQLSSEKSNAMECWPNCTRSEDMLRQFALMGLPATILGVLIAALAALWRSRRH